MARLKPVGICQAPSRMVNSPMKPFRAGSPMEESVMIMKKVA